ncbi:MAG: GNAT superfamily N-acetyltransferase [Spirosomataceae bacterium]|jgi:GNAT superfamily N-acetyltransferase
MSLKIRKGNASDVPEIMRLVRELAIYEKAEHEISNTNERMLEEGFSKNPAFGVFIGELDGDILGIALYYYRYSTWKGKRIYLEDLIVSEDYRGKGYGKALFESVIDEGKSNDCSGMMWQVIDWNKSAIDFYETYGTRFDEEWINCHLEF